jgi:hypothetical protein
MRTITPAQQGFVARLVAERDATAFDPILTARVDEARIGALPFGEVTGLLNALKRIPRPAAAAAAKAEPGYYLTAADEVIVVVETKDKQRTYAKRLTFHTGEDGAQRARWEYAPGVGRTLAGIAPLTAEQAARLGHLHGVCVICAKPLTDPASVERGIGPVCVRRLTSALAA